ncbi:TniQ family protein [Pandoraea commovens]|uniref:TniQ family protein n=1 Tax=Pandoraea commovens TaxID=2508289 RepID=UPI00356B728B
MVRLAFSNGFPLHTFYANLLGYKAAIWNRDTDRHPSMALLEVLARRTGQSISAMRALTLSAYDNILFSQLPPVGNASWILPVGVHHRNRRRAGMQFCPLCLRSDTDPYFRRSWRLALHAMCGCHRCVMAEYCPACREPVAYHRHGIGRDRVIPDRALSLCHRCGFDLRETQPVYSDWPDLRSLQSFSDLITYSAQGEWDFGRLTPACPLLFFVGLRALISAIGGHHGQRLRRWLGDTFHCCFNPQCSANHIEFERLGASERLRLLLAAVWLLNDWPSRFVEMCAECEFTRSRLAEQVSALPFWLASVADEYLDNRHYMPNADEIFSAGSYLRAHCQSVTPRTLGALLDLSRDCASTAWRTWLERRSLSASEG